MTELLFWAAAGLIVYAYAGYPCGLAALAAVRRRPVRRHPIRPRVSFIITAHNEAARIGAKIENTLAQDYPPALLEILVASDCSTDGTDEIVAGYAGQVRLVRALERGGKEAAQRLAIAQAGGDVLIFSDVATALATGGVSTIVRNFADPSVGCVSSVDRFVNDSGTGSGEGAYVRYEMLLRALESDVNSLVGLSGSFFAARREVCANWPPDRQSDFSTLLTAVEMGLRGVLDPEAIGYYRTIVDPRREHDRKLRTVIRGIAVLMANRRMLNPAVYGLFAWQLISHKLCRWLVPFAMIAALLANLALAWESPAYIGPLVVQSAFYLVAAAGMAGGFARFRVPAFLVRSNAAVLEAWIRYACGERITSWRPSDRLAALPAREP
jgi:glycosyltransferase involved in cell wall biosynthesis